ncbi:MAG: hypothetical protein UR32_C0003G0019 [candidate division WS6 bacterium GW2011_GWE2_33_157]|uniref:Uncharacterized protein n=1 Tax=candidate division WS6 bacterium GW2011_GWB1_33_6 TaxID=1619088 RepID=A0A0G0AFT3_9BACT|nr:MAG: hypothetical protein UR32_C0003G0019 [candidate division WS6 bacterium GW2011_GWE2_33_157]KKP46030.1 MAG: hypothetical protein UR36_C0002G0072 [candidate division WS6 bacterium GW2011_GWF1_33_233]KKP55458.1 MAG: hypothetical protein UR47_C0001G0019 [candidate division WS6 bacterium GW2011_GWB1_33_6]KKP55537.1 MAG: hypothetical protein UR45_C0001G0019 [candidate division WS6 bacterium GW2011_WS6_33_547]KKP82348.1 MAG: hypothetical protein UR84_C0004G0019 [candidate division WS6 bacterium
MKRKNIFILSIVILLSILLGYILYYIFLLEDEQLKYEELLNEANVNTENTSNSATIYVKEFDSNSCNISYCVNNKCGLKLYLPCDKLDKNEYSKEGLYKISLGFEKSEIFVFRDKVLDSWSIYKPDIKEEKYEKSFYINGVKELLNNFPIRQGFACLISLKTDEPENWICNSDFSITYDYLKSIYLTYELGKKLNDNEMLNSVNEEIMYLNSNSEELIKAEYNFPEAYILKLIDIGLSEEYLKIISDFEIPEYRVQTLTIHDSLPYLPNEGEILSKRYVDILRYSDYHTVFNEYGMEELSSYYYNESVRRYNSSEYVVNGLCTIGYSTSNPDIYKYVKDELEFIISSNGDDLILENITELFKCSLLSDKMESTINGLSNEIESLVKRSTISIDNNAYIVNTTTACVNEEKVCNHVIRNFRLVDNLMYILYE